MLRFSIVHNSLTMRYVFNKARSPNTTRSTMNRVLQKRKKSTSVTISDANCACPHRPKRPIFAVFFTSKNHDRGP